jgi:hypothetical protein
MVSEWGQSLLLLAFRKDCRILLAFLHLDSLLIWSIFVFHYNVPIGVLIWGCFLNDGPCSRKGLKGKLRGLEIRSQRITQRGAMHSRYLKILSGTELLEYLAFIPVVQSPTE